MRGTTSVSRPGHIATGAKPAKRRVGAGGRASLFLAAAVTLTAGTSAALGQALTWDASGSGTPTDGPGNWNTTTDANWLNGAPPDVVWSNGSVASFGANGGTAGTVTINDPAGVSATGLVFNAPGSGNYTIAGGGTGVLTLTGAGTLSVASGVSPTIAAPIAGSVGLSVSGPGTLNLAGNNTFTGTVAINSGSVVVAAGGNLGASTNAVSLGTPNAGAATTDPTGALTIASGTTTTAGSFLSAPNNTAVNTLTINSGSTLSVTGNGTLAGPNATTNASFIVGSPNVNSQITTKLTLTGGGALNVSGGANNSSFLVGLGNANSSANNMLPTLDMTGLANFTFTTGTGAVPAGGGNEFAVGHGGGAGAVATLATNNTITAGTITVGDNAITPGLTGTIPAPNAPSNNNILNLGGGTNVLNANNIVIGSLRAQGTVKWGTAATNATLTIAGAAGGTSTADITVGNYTLGTPPGTASMLDLTNSSSTGNTINVQAGTVTLGIANGAASGTGANKGGTISFDTGTFNAANVKMGVVLSGATGGNMNGTFNVGSGPSSTGVLNVSNSFVIAAYTSGTPTAKGTLNVKGGTANINADIIDISTGGTSNTTVALTGGTLNMMGHAIGTTAAGTGGKRTITTLTFPALGNSAVLMNLGGNGINNAGLNMNGTGILILEGSNNYTGGTTVSSGTLQVGQASDTVAPTGALQASATNNATLSFGSSQSLAVATTISGTGTVAQTGTGTTTLAGSSGYTGPTSVVNGTLAVASLPNGGASGPIGASSNAAANLLFTGGTLQYTGPAAATNRLFTVTPAGGRLDAAGTGPITFNNAGAIVSADAAARATTTSTSNAKVTLPNVADLVVGMTVAGANVPAGTTILSINPTASSITLSNTPTVAGADTLSFGAVARTLTLSGASAGNNTIASTLSNSSGGGALNLTKTGTGTWVLTGPNNYTGTTTVSGGKLILRPGAWTPVTSGAGGANVTAGRMVFDYTSSSSPAATVVPLLTTAAHNSNFATGQIRSTTASAIRTLGYYDDAAASAFTVMATYFGDLNLDGKVNADDFALLDRGAAKALTGWVNGDVDYSGAVDANDYLLTDTAFANQGGTLSPAFLADREARFGSEYVASLVAAVPEPGVALPIVVGLAGALGGRRRGRAGR